MAFKTVSVHIVAYNSESDIIPCLESVLRQTYPISEIIVVDNASQDNTVQLVKQFFAEHPNAQLRLIENEKNVGFAEAHNQAIRVTDSHYVLVLNPDVVLHEEYIHHLVLCMEESPFIGSCAGKLYRNDDGNIIDSTGLVINKARRAFDRGAGETDQGQWDEVNEVFGVSGAAAFYRREMIQDIMLDEDFFDSHFFAYKEDVDVAWRSRLFGWKAYYVPQAIAVHKRGWAKDKKRQHIPLHIRRHSFNNRYFMMLKNDSIKYFILHLPHILVFEIASLLYFLVKERQMLHCYRQLMKFSSLMKNKRKLLWEKVSLKNVPFDDIYRFFR